MNDHVYIGVTAVTDRRDTVRSLTKYLSRRTQSSPKNLDELKHQPTHCAIVCCQLAQWWRNWRKNTLRH
ncbi:hypothetical protein OAO50_09120 [Paracoccaceae bacterium]|nr:hypothetical protein [Paracoccaceae bacterium]